MKAPQGFNSSRRVVAFTLIDLLALMLIIGMISLAFLPALARVEDHGRRMACLNNLRQLGVGLVLYAESFGGTFFSPRFSAGASIQTALNPPEATYASHGGLALTNPQTAMLWACPARPGLPLYESMYSFYTIGYQYLAAVPTWQNPAGSFTAVSPRRLTLSKPHWVLAADTIIKVNGVWGGVEPGRGAVYENIPPHRTDDSRFPQGGNEVFVDGSARWIGFEQMYFLQGWSTARPAYFYQDPKDFPPALVSALPMLKAVP